MSHRFSRALVTLIVSCAAGALVHASVPTFWQVSTEADWLRGDAENLTIDAYGRLTLGPSVASVYDATVPFIWTLASAADGSVYAGTGNDGQVYRIDPAGRATLYFDAEELEVHAMVSAPGGGLYVATSPEGRIYKVDADGRSRVFFDPDNKYIWSLAIDRQGNLFAGTGDKGVIYRITPDGRGAPFYDTRASHVMSLTFDREGRLLAGTGSPGRVFRIDPSGKPFVLLESGYNEIHQIRVDANDRIFAVAVRSRATAVAPRQPAIVAPMPVAPPGATVTAEVTSVTVLAPSASGPSQTAIRTATGQTSGALFRIMPDGASDVVWESRDDTPYDVAFENADILLATGNKGKVYRLSGDPLQPTLVTRADAGQVTALLPDVRGRILLATSNPGKIFRLSGDRAPRGTYLSEIQDAMTLARWGSIRWNAATPTGTSIDISTRSGNTATADDTWSDWAPAYRNADGSAITSPSARYLQWRATLMATGSAAPVLNGVTVAYLPRNLRPRVTAIVVHPPGTVFQRTFPTEPGIAGFEGQTPDQRALADPDQATDSPSLGRRVYEKGLVTIVWRGEDDNRDDLTYDVFYRLEGDTVWTPLTRQLTDPLVVWDTTAVPNGRYVIRIVASDALSNSPSATLTGANESQAFDIDNTPPVVTIGSVQRADGRTTIAFSVTDRDSAVRKAEYSRDGDRWETIYPKDGIADSRSEEFELVVTGEIGPRGLVIRATDALGNATSASAATSATAPVSGRTATTAREGSAAAAARPASGRR